MIIGKKTSVFRASLKILLHGLLHAGMVSLSENLPYILCLKCRKYHMASLNRRNFVTCIAIGFFVGILLKLFAFDILTVKGTSMEPALHDGEKILVNKLAYGLQMPFSSRLLFSWNPPRPNDVIVYLLDDNYVVKRCAGTGGMKLEYASDSRYDVEVGGRHIPLTKIQYHLLEKNEIVPFGTVFAVGDNVEKSIDSRAYGFVDVKNILGRVVLR